MQSYEKISLSEVKACLERSGYLMESRMVRALSESGYFVEPNVAHKDPRTGKSREIDLVAEDSSRLWNRHAGVCAKTYFIIEAVNNRYPIVLLTERESTPNSNFESYLKYGWTPISCPFENEILLYDEKNADHQNLFSQYCALTKKKTGDEFMASHPEDMYSSLLKLSEYTEDEKKSFELWAEELESDFWRIFFWHPMLVVSGELMVAKVAGDGNIQLHEVPLARLEFNWHDTEEKCTTVIEVVREDFLMERLDAIRKQDIDIEKRMYASNSKYDAKAPSERDASRNDDEPF